MDLGTAGPQNTGGAGADTLTGIENLAGSPFADQLSGDAHANALTGWEGEDSVNAEGGNDLLAVRDGTRDLVTCGPGVDSVHADTQGLDTIFSDCENTAVAPFLPPPGGARYTEPPPPDGGTTTEPAVPPLLDQLTFNPRRFSAAKRGPSVARPLGTRVSYRLSEAATVNFDVQRASVGRHVRGACVRPTRSNRRAGRCRRCLRMPGTFRHSGLTGVNGLHFNGRLAGRRLRPGRYRFRAIASDLAGNRSRRRTAGFTIVRS